MESTRNDHHDHPERSQRRASPTGAYVATLGALILLVSVWLDWVTLGPKDAEGNPSSGYEGDSLIPFLAYLALGFAIALLYATKRADRRQHRGLSLASFAAGFASLLWALSFLLDPISTVQYSEDVSIEVGPWIALIGSLLWALGSFLLAKEPEGDFEDDHRTVARPVATHTETHAVGDHTDTAHTTSNRVSGSHATGGDGLADGSDFTQRRGNAPR